MRSDRIAYFASFLLNQILSTMVPGPTKQGALEGILGPLSCRSAAHTTERTVLLRMTQLKSKNWNAHTVKDEFKQFSKNQDKYHI